MFLKKFVEYTQKFFYQWCYKKFTNQFWPIVSYHKHDISVLNIAYPDRTSIYHSTSFDAKDTVILSGSYPENCLFWNITFYDDRGIMFYHVEESDFPSFQYTIIVSQKKDFTPSVIPPCRYFSVIQRLYTVPYEDMFPKYLPNIRVIGKSVSYPLPETRVIQSTRLQDNFRWFSFYKSPSVVFPNINRHEFFIPSISQMENVFMNPQALYMILFPPSSSSILRINGVLPPNVGHDCLIQYISFMTGDLGTTRTDNAVSYFELSYKYTLFVCKDATRVKNHPLYDSDTDRILEWNSCTKCPVLIFRILLSSFQTIQPHHFFQDTPVEKDVLEPLFGQIYPRVSTIS